jgi:CheY-like chemotaxis protein
LIVDDDAFARDALAQILQEEGYAVTCAANGREALRLLRSAPLPDLILLDLVMPVLDGFSFCRLQERDARLASVPVLVVSAEDVAPGAASAAPQVVGRVPKPIAVEELLECIRQCF